MILKNYFSVRMHIQKESVELLHKCMIFLSLVSPQHYDFVKKPQSGKHLNAINLAKPS